MQALDGSLHHHAPPQVYTFGVLPPGASVHGKVDAFQPMRPLLHAPPAVCTVNVSADVVTGAGSGGFSAAIANRGSIPCLYMRLQLWDSKVLPAEAPQFHAAEFQDNFVTLLPGESMAVGFYGLPCKTVSAGKPCKQPSNDCSCGKGGTVDTLCVSGWNVARVCEALPRMSSVGGV